MQMLLIFMNKEKIIFPSEIQSQALALMMHPDLLKLEWRADFVKRLERLE